MTLHRHPLGLGRIVALGSAILIIVGSILPWFRVGGSDGIPPIEGNAFAGAGILVFLAGLATVALVALPFAAGDRPIALDRWWAYAAVTAVGVIGLALRVVAISGDGGGTEAMLPDRAPGIWLAAAGVIGLIFATAQLYGERRA